MKNHKFQVGHWASTPPDILDRMSTLMTGDHSGEDIEYMFILYHQSPLAMCVGQTQQPTPHASVVVLTSALDFSALKTILDP
jgi:hypothetical protein